MATDILKMKPAPPVYGPGANGILLTPRQFDRARFEEGYRYELINGVLIVSQRPFKRTPAPMKKRATPSAVLKRTSALAEYGPGANGILLTPRQFDRARFEEGYRYELINGVLIVSVRPSEEERDPNDELGHLLRSYRDNHPEGHHLNATLPEHTLRTGDKRRVADRAIWAGLGRRPRRSEFPSIVAEFVSKGKRNVKRDYETKRDEYMRCGAQQYWIFDRFRRTLTVYLARGRRVLKRVYDDKDTYTTELLPGFELPLARLFEFATIWEDDDA